MTTTRLDKIVPRGLLLPILFAAALFATGANASRAIENPLIPPNTASPQGTLSSFMSALEEAYQIAGESRPSRDTLDALERARRCLNLSELAPDLGADAGIEAAVMLKEVLDRIALPPLEQVPDLEDVDRSRQDAGVLRLLDMLKQGTTDMPAEQLAQRRIERWTIPDTDIALALVTEGPRKGEFLFTPQTVARVPDFYQRVQHLPYRSGATPNIYDAYILTPGRGLQLEWDEGLPAWSEQIFAGQTVWQWLLALIALALLVALIRAALVLGARLDRHGHAATPDSNSTPARARPHILIGTLISVLASAGMIVAADWFVDDVVNITGQPLVIIKHILIFAKYGFLSWLAGLALTQTAELIVRARKLRPKGPQSQLLRLGSRLIALIVIPGILVYAAHQVGLPAYSVITGLGVGGLAVALAARETLANLFGSLMIMFDRPYRIGDWIKLGDNEGTVEDIGFRSTRIRTFYDSLLSIPNSESVSMPIDNMGMRSYRRVYTTIGIRYDTPPERIEAFLEGIKRIIQANPMTRKDYFHVVLNNFGPSSLEIMLYFFLQVPDWSAELVERQRVFLEVSRLADALDVEFAFPTQTLQIESLPGQPVSPPTGAGSADELRHIAAAFGKDGAEARPRGSKIFIAPNEEVGR